MSLTLLKNTSIINFNKKTSFKGTGGTPPYSYAITTNNSGGSIDAASGAYTAGPVKGLDTITVTDSAGTPATATAQINVVNHLVLFCDILQTELGLADGRVYLWNQKIKMPTDEGLFIAVGISSPKSYGNGRTLQSSGTQVMHKVNMRLTLSLDIISRGMDAVDRKEEVLMALNSIYSQQQQQANSFYIAPVSSQLTNLSTEDGSAIPYRFNISVNIHYSVQKLKTVPYYDTYQDVSTLVDT